MNSFLVLTLLFFTAHLPNINGKNARLITTIKPVLIKQNVTRPLGTRYMLTGFYFLAEKGKGVNMRIEKSKETCNISPSAFASVRNISKTELKKTHLKDGDYTELCMTFDNQGTKDLAEGTGNSLHPKIAIVIANKLLYVVDNTTSIKTGVMYIGLIGYSEQEMKQMQISVNNKQ